MGVWHNLPTFLYGCALSRLHSQPLMSLWLRASFDVSRYRAHASRALAFAAAHVELGTLTVLPPNKDFY
jgi:hypothetical protein